MTATPEGKEDDSQPGVEPDAEEDVAAVPAISGKDESEPVAAVAVAVTPAEEVKGTTEDLPGVDEPFEGAEQSDPEAAAQNPPEEAQARDEDPGNNNGNENGNNNLPEENPTISEVRPEEFLMEAGAGANVDPAMMAGQQYDIDRMAKVRQRITREVATNAADGEHEQLPVHDPKGDRHASGSHGIH